MQTISGRSSETTSGVDGEEQPSPPPAVKNVRSLSYLRFRRISRSLSGRNKNFQVGVKTLTISINSKHLFFQ